MKTPIPPIQRISSEAKPYEQLIQIFSFLKDERQDIFHLVEI